MAKNNEPKITKTPKATEKDLEKMIASFASIEEMHEAVTLHQLQTLKDKQDEDADHEIIEREQKDWERGLKIFNETGIQLVNTEAEWIVQIRDYCKRNEIYPPHIL